MLQCYKFNSVSEKQKAIGGENKSEILDYNYLALMTTPADQTIERSNQCICDSYCLKNDQGVHYPRVSSHDITKCSAQLIFSVYGDMKGPYRQRYENALDGQIQYNLQRGIPRKRFSNQRRWVDGNQAHKLPL